jgi:hypothetical protein
VSLVQFATMSCDIVWSMVAIIQVFVPGLLQVCIMGVRASERVIVGEAHVYVN